ncbi:glycosyltransferase family 4 protein [Bacteroides cellulosilyticus]|jgi:glycosyltransferase involved in cell wall biosynthesis|uniref:glycosyltransferase family 4 protein n=1 Tax=Bacteroides cellulosilyticus TaxID=246787 RepID=UPI001D00CFAA|nr:glycosyltransferase family 4 protein [Bacteroides cellulosilyticus]
MLKINLYHDFCVFLREHINLYSCLKNQSYRTNWHRASAIGGRLSGRQELCFTCVLSDGSLEIASKRLFLSNVVRKILPTFVLENEKTNIAEKKDRTDYAVVALYVTEYQLQKRYPVNNSIFSISASNVQISSRILPSSDKILYKKEKYNLLSVGSLEQMYKAPDVVLEALTLLKDREVHCGLTWLGEGKNKGEMQKLASALHITNDVNFKGNVSQEEVDEELRKSDLFLLASRTKGLPCVLIEAMAMGLPCNGVQVGGISELLDKQMLIRTGDSLVLANKIEFLLTHIDMTNKEANRNYYDSVLQQRRESFYQ